MESSAFRYTAYLSVLFSFLLVTYAAVCQSRTVSASRIILIGHARNAVSSDSRFLDAVRERVPIDSNTIVLYLGNNIADAADTGLLRAESDIIRNTGATVIFIPGYEDWHRSGSAGYRTVLAEQHFLKRLGDRHIRFYPGDGCPGPKKIELDHDAVMYIMDSQWWLHEGTKPGMESDCKYRTKEDLLAEIEDIPKEEFDKLVLFVTFHPLENTGVHSGSFGLKQHLFPLTDIPALRNAYLPLPLLGSLYPIMRNAISATQDLQNPEYQSMANDGIRTSAGVNEAFSLHPNTVFIAGQEHNLQLLQKHQHYYINVGGAGTPSRVRNGKDAIYVKEKAGFAVMELSAEKKLRLSFYVVSGGKASADYSTDLLSYATIPPLAKDTTTMPMLGTDSISAAANARMAHTSLLTRILVGENYRKEWSTPVRMKVLRPENEKGGLSVTGIGGGHESRSLQLKDTSGVKWVFRTSNKNLDAVIPEGFRQTIASDYIQDLLSASNPYGALVVAGLQDSMHIVQSHPVMRFMPNDSTLGNIRPLFANNVGILEERKPALNERGQISTTDALNNMVDAGDHFADQNSYLKVRLLDFLIADFDRHHGQYSWGMTDSAGRTFYYPIPKDRDQAFYNNKGLIMAIERHGAYKFQVNFPYHIRSMRDMCIVGAYMDNVFLNRLTAADWQRDIDSFCRTLTDAVIDTAVHRFPPEIYAIRGPVVSAKLKSRRADIREKGMNYYRFISRRVNVLGGNGDDVFRLTGNDSGLLVQVFARDSSGAPQLRFARTFDPHATKEIRLFGFRGNDRFDVAPSARSRIRLHMVGGSGSDTFCIRGAMRNHLYDLSTEENIITARSRTTKMFSTNPRVNEFQFRETLHNAFDLPLITVGYNIEDEVIVGIGLAYRAYAFRKTPYASLQRFVGSFASANNAYMVRYKGEFIDVLRHYDLLINVDNYNPVLKNFFGFGNESTWDPNVSVKYYRTRYDYLSADVMVRQRFHRGNTFSIAAGPSFYYYWYEPAPNRGRVLEHPAMVGLDSQSVFAKKSYAGGKAVFAINTLNSDLLPTRGINWTTDFTALQSLNESAKSYTRLLSALDIYSILDQPNRLLLSLHLGGGHIFSNHFEYYQALTLGGNNYLRGYRVNRFAGASMAYGSVALRVKLFDFNVHVLKGDFGLVGFNDVGRVWMPGEDSRKWHDGYGAGIYLTPFNSVMVSVLAGFSDEDTLLNFSIGTKLNLVYQGM
jgi:hypothetical protein